MGLSQPSTGTVLVSSVILSSVMNLGMSEKLAIEPNVNVKQNVNQVHPTLLFGQEGEAITQLQVFLSTFMYYKGHVDGLYGLLTKQAVRDYQRAHDLKADGIAGKKTLNHLYHEHTDVYNTVSLNHSNNISTFYTEDMNDTTTLLLSAEPTKTLTKMSELSTELTIRVDDKGKAVTMIQEKLAILGYYNHIDGIYGPQTKAAIMHYQSAHHLHVDGVAGPETIGHLTSDKQKKNYQDYLKGLQKRAAQNVHQERTVIPSENVTRQVERSLTTGETRTTVNEEAIIPSENKSKQQEKSSPAQNNSSIISTAKSLIGTPYKWGGTTRSGFDCSGFLQYVYKQHGKSIPRTTTSIWGASSPTSTLQPGDLVFFTTYKSGPSHVGIYLGNRQFIHASSSKGVTISNMDISYWNTRYLGARTLK
ncbi:peptidoglycan-binding protein [Alkalihalobacillus sp. BA299]|uniref:C40 family peptidase n=1 Tax=Alkalihalobacillus sp. BA299 TaxID=2815938 RepID=UPI001ADC1CF0|nr:peptidoglycan-binding protein [Alkalihalobacillus sp. BA299]